MLAAQPNGALKRLRVVGLLRKSCSREECSRSHPHDPSSLMWSDRRQNCRYCLEGRGTSSRICSPPTPVGLKLHSRHEVFRHTRCVCVPKTEAEVASQADGGLLRGQTIPMQAL
jgi:hypothetical protein